MQAFSYLQRDIANQNYFSIVVIGICLVVWGAISTLNPYLPPMFGLLCVAVYAVRRREFTIMVLIYLLFFEADRNYMIFSSWLFLWLFVSFLLPAINKTVDCKKCILLGGIALSYGLFFLYLRVLELFLHASFSPIAWLPVIIYIAIEALLALVLES